ncbi:hypothetical protein SUGI_0496750 [Cryptomeria japonica]|nr:hypothetical protein SUGI_0496750 [Cryptomeria japonica]
MAKAALASGNFMSLETAPPAVVSVSRRPSAKRLDPIEEEAGHEIHGNVTEGLEVAFHRFCKVHLDIKDVRHG